MGELELAEGLLEQGRSHLEEALALAAPRERIDIEYGAQRALAEHDLIQGRADLARERLETLLERSGGPAIYSMTLLPWLALAYLELGIDGQARDISDQCVMLVRTARVRPYLTDTLRVQAQTLMRQQRWEEAIAALEESITICRAMPHPWAEAKALLVYGQLHEASGEPERARKKYEQALVICNRLGEGLYRPRIEHALAQLDG
jgi:tetratricopeptide (TPR) repeat protein